MFSGTSVDKLSIKIDCSSMSKDGRIEAIHNVLKHWTTTIVIWTTVRCLAWSLVGVRHQWMVAWSQVCFGTTDTLNRSSVDAIIFMWCVFSAICNIHISHLCYDVSVHLYVMEVHWHIIANLGFKFRSQFTSYSSFLLILGFLCLKARCRMRRLVAVL